jgi:lysophospholipase L1-like esterase
VASADAYTKMVDTDNFELFPDHLHFDATGQQALGNAFAAAMQILVAPN